MLERADRELERVDDESEHVESVLNRVTNAAFGMSHETKDFVDLCSLPCIARFVQLESDTTSSSLTNTDEDDDEDFSIVGGADDKASLLDLDEFEIVSCEQTTDVPEVSNRVNV
jgi:hypothetical protein